MYNVPYHGEKDLSNLSFLVTGGAGFIGSNLVAYLLKFGAGKVRVLDNFSTGSVNNLENLSFYPSFEIIDDDILNLNAWKSAVSDIDIILHQVSLTPGAGLFATGDFNIRRLNMLIAANIAGVKKIVDAASFFLDHAVLQTAYERPQYSSTPDPITKYVNAFYADLLNGMYGTGCIGLQYATVFGPHQSASPSDIITTFIASLMAHKSLAISEEASSRGFTYIENAVQANIIAALSDNSLPVNKIYKVEREDQTTLTELAVTLRDILALIDPAIAETDLSFSSFKEINSGGNVVSADAGEVLCYEPYFTLREGLLETVKYYMDEDKSSPVFH